MWWHILETANKNINIRLVDEAGDALVDHLEIVTENVYETG